MFIIIPTYSQISSVKLILKLLRHVSILIHHLQGVYRCKLQKLQTADTLVNSLKMVY